MSETSPEFQPQHPAMPNPELPSDVHQSEPLMPRPELPPLDTPSSMHQPVEATPAPADIAKAPVPDFELREGEERFEKDPYAAEVMAQSEVNTGHMDRIKVAEVLGLGDKVIEPLRQTLEQASTERKEQYVKELEKTDELLTEALLKGEAIYTRGQDYTTFHRVHSLLNYRLLSLSEARYSNIRHETMVYGPYVLFYSPDLITLRYNPHDLKDHLKPSRPEGPPSRY